MNNDIWYEPAIGSAITLCSRDEKLMQSFSYESLSTRMLLCANENANRKWHMEYRGKSRIACMIGYP